jgi:linoleoyl-CoA desaturase
MKNTAGKRQYSTELVDSGGMIEVKTDPLDVFQQLHRDLDALDAPAPVATTVATTPQPLPTGVQLPSGGELRARIMPTQGEIVAARRRLHAKAAAVLITVVASYATLLAGGLPWFARLAAVPFLLVSLIMVATNVMHDANHRAFFAGSKQANNLVGYASDLLGVSSVLWRIKHDIHHASPNVQGVDPDIDQGIVARLAPEQERLWWHRSQHRYLWPLYGLLGVQWLLVSDFTDLLRGRIGDQSLKGLGIGTRAGIFLGKALHVSWAIALPMLWYPWWAVAFGYLASSWCIGIVLSVTFQVAHCVDAAEFLLPETPRRGDDFVWHQMRTTVNVAPNNSLLGRFRSLILGGLDYQIEHHLAPEVPHTAYAAMALRLKQSCTALDVTYRSHPNVWGAIRSHHRWLRSMASAH